MRGTEATRGRVVAAAALLVAATALAYAPSLGNGFIWDDDQYVQDNPTLRTGEGLRRIWLELRATPQYYPLVHSSFWLEYRLWELDPAGYHAVNVTLHALAAVLLWRLLVALAVPGAWLAAALFALHPVQVESVAWITERKNVLSLVFYLAAAGFWLRWAGIIESQKRAGRYGMALLLFLGALLSKTVTCSLPAALLLVVWWKGRITRRHVVSLVPFFVLGAGLGLLTAWLETHHVGARGADWELTFLDRVLVAGRALWFYAGKLAWPEPLIFFYPRWRIDAADPAQYLYPAAALVCVAALWVWRARLGRGPLVAVLFFGGTLFPALGFFDVYPMQYSWVADHFQYLACIGLLVLVAAAGTRLAQRAGRRVGYAAAGAAALWLTLLGLLTWRQTHAYADLETLWRDTLAKNPGAWAALNNLGLLLLQRGEAERAIDHFRLALAARNDYAPSLTNLGIVLASREQRDEAILLYERALVVRPDSVQAHSNLANALAARGELDDAKEHYDAAIALRPYEPSPLNGLAWVLATHPDPARRDARRAVELATRASRLTGDRNASVLDTLAAAQASAGDFHGALETASTALVLAREADDVGLLRELQARMELYRASRPHLEKAR